MTPRARASLLWGLVGALSFLVLLQGYELLAARRVDWLVKLGVAVVVLVTAAALSHVTYSRRMRRKERT